MKTRYHFKDEYGEVWNRKGCLPFSIRCHQINGNPRLCLSPYEVSQSLLSAIIGFNYQAQAHVSSGEQLLQPPPPPPTPPHPRLKKVHLNGSAIEFYCGHQTLKKTFVTQHHQMRHKSHTKVLCKWQIKEQ